MYLIKSSKLEHYLMHGRHGTLASVTRRNPHEVHHSEHRDVVVVRNRPQMKLTGQMGNMRTQAADWGLKHIRGTYRNSYSELSMQVGSKGVKEAASHAYSENELQTISAIPQLIKHAVLFDISPHEPPKVDYGDVYTFYGIMKQQGRTYLAKLVAKQVQKNKLHYDHQAIEIVMPDVAPATHGHTNSHRITPPSGINSVISLHQLVDYVNALHPEHVESFHKLHKSIKPPPQNDLRKSHHRHRCDLWCDSGVTKPAASPRFMPLHTKSHVHDAQEHPMLTQLIPRLFILRKSQLPLFDPHHVAYVRHSRSGAISNIKAKGTTARHHDFAPRGNIGENIDSSYPKIGVEFEPGAVKSWGIEQGEMESLIHGMVADVPNYTFTVRGRVHGHKMDILFDGKEVNGDGELFIERTIYNDPDKKAYHANFDATKTGGGIARAVNRACMHMYQQLELDHVWTYANCDVGGYAWAKFGFTPRGQGDWSSLKAKIHRRLETCADGNTTKHTADKNWEFRQFTPEEVERVREYLESDNPKTLWQIADYKGYDGLDIGKALLLNHSWTGKLDMHDHEAMHRFAEYVNPKPQKIKVTQLSLFE